jgi:fibronectin type 3 domain-containing protein
MMKSRYFSLIFGCLFTILSCQNTIDNNKDRPDTVKFVEKSEEYEIPEKGIDAIPEEIAIFIEWFRHDNSEIEKYQIYRQTDPLDDFYLIDTIQDTFYIDIITDIIPRYYYYVIAVNYDNIKSESSDTLSYQLLEKPTPLAPSGLSQSVSPDFQWEDHTQPQANYYILRVIRSDDGAVIWNATVQANLGFAIQNNPYNSDQSASISELKRGIGYQWRVDVIGSEDFCGSESVWTSFQIQ